MSVVTIEAPLAAKPLIVELYRQVLRAGGHPVPRVKLGRAPELFYAEATGDQLDWLTPAFRGANESSDVRIIVEAEENTKSLSERRSRGAGTGQPRADGGAQPLPGACGRG